MCERVKVPFYSVSGSILTRIKVPVDIHNSSLISRLSKTPTMSFMHVRTYIQIYIQNDFCVHGSVTICMEIVVYLNQAGKREEKKSPLLSRFG